VYDVHDSRTSVQTDHPLDRTHSISRRIRPDIRLSVKRARITFDNRLCLVASFVAKRKTAQACAVSQKTDIVKGLRSLTQLRSLRDGLPGIGNREQDGHQYYERTERQ
jgi:hypothetical protein